MEYNTSRKKLIFPEYGRNIQLLVDYAQTIQNPEEQDKTIKAIIAVMGSMNPHLRDIPDFKHKLWDHLAIMSDFKLPINSPYPLPDKNNLYTKPSKVEYNAGEIKHRHFGRIVETLIKKAETITEPDRKNELIKTITNHMKKSYLLWNKENVSDDVIFEALKDISHGKLEVEDENLKLIDSQTFINKKQNKGKQNNGNQKNGNLRNPNGNQRNGNQKNNQRN